MKTYLLSLVLLLALVQAAHAQMGLNAPAGLAPVRDIEIYSRDVFVVQQKYIPTTDPISGTFIMSCAASPPNLTATAGVLLDPGGTGNYLASLTCTQTILTPGNPSSVGYELTFTQFGTEANGDSVVIEGVYNGRIAFSGSALPPVLLVPGYQFKVIVKADNDGNVGSGFALRWRRVSMDPSSTGGGARIFGNSLQFDLRKGALVGGFNRVGALQQAGDYSTALGGGSNTASGDYSTALGGGSNTASGDYSTALGGSNTASGYGATALGIDNTAIGYGATALGIDNEGGDYSTAMGSGNTATGDGATALGGNNRASGRVAAAFGYFNTASGDYATAFGRNNTASGESAMAVGYLNTASGNYSTAMGHRMNTSGQAGAFMIGDSDPLGQGTTSAGAPDQFVARFRNGYYLMTSGTVTRTGVVIGAGQNAWSAISDSTRKERFVPMNHAEVLRKINTMKLTSWNYKGQREIRHYGPMAQDFYAAFGHDGLGPIGCDTLINSHDFAGVTFAGVQALIRENEQLKTRLNAVENENAQIKADLSARLHLLERAMLTRRERVSLRKSKP